MPLTSRGAQPLSLISSLSVEVRPKRKGRGACPVESLQRKRGKMSSGDSERILAVSGHRQAILCLPDREQEQGLPFLFQIDIVVTTYREDDREEGVQKFIVTVPLLMGHQETNRSKSRSNNKKVPHQKVAEPLGGNPPVSSLILKPNGDQRSYQILGFRSPLFS